MQDNNNVDLSFYLSPYKDYIKNQIEEAELKALRERSRRDDYKAFLITTVKMPEFYFVSFITHKEAKEKANSLATKHISHGYEKLAVSRCCKYLADSTGLTDTRHGIFFSLKPKRANNLDRFIGEGKAPVYELMENGIKFRCKNCGKGKFGLEEYNEKKCYILEGEGEYNYFTRGIVFCEDCYHSLYQESP